MDKQEFLSAKDKQEEWEVDISTEGGVWRLWWVVCEQKYASTHVAHPLQYLGMFPTKTGSCSIEFRMRFQ